MDVSTIVAILSALGIRELIGFVGRHVAGGPERERSAIREERELRKAAETDRDLEARRRRLIQEHASELRRELVEAGRDPASLPPWPTT